MNIVDYVDMRGDLTFAERPFNEVDNLVLAELAYAEMKDIVADTDTFTVSLAELYEKYVALGYQSLLVNDPKPLLERVAAAPRYQGVRLGAYVDRVDPEQEVQFAGVTFMLDDGTAYVAYRGTDNTIVGWREDFNFSYLTETPGQSDAVAYLNRIAACTGCPLRVGGHSKGGNFALYASAFCEESVRRDRVKEIYSNDGPGFKSSVADSAEYAAVLDKVIKIIPESSLIGILLTSKVQPRVVASDAKGLMQHDPYSWRVRGAAFERVDGLSPASLYMNETLKKWMDTLNDEQKKAFVNAIFDSLDASGAFTLSEMNANKWVSYNAILRAVSEISKTSVYGEVTEALKKLAEAGKDVFWNEARRSFEQIGQNRRVPSDDPDGEGKVVRITGRRRIAAADVRLKKKGGTPSAT